MELRMELKRNLNKQCINQTIGTMWYKDKKYY